MAAASSCEIHNNIIPKYGNRPRLNEGLMQLCTDERDIFYGGTAVLSLFSGLVAVGAHICSQTRLSGVVTKKTFQYSLAIGATISVAALVSRIFFAVKPFPLTCNRTSCEKLRTLLNEKLSSDTYFSKIVHITGGTLLAGAFSMDLSRKYTQSIELYVGVTVATIGLFILPISLTDFEGVKNLEDRAKKAIKPLLEETFPPK